MASEQIVQISSCAIGATAITGVTAVSYTETATTVSNRADAEIYQTGKKVVSVDVSGTISGIDQETFAEVGIGTTGSLVFTGKKVSDNADKTTTILNCVVTGIDPTQNHSTEGSVTLTFEAYSADGTTSPISFSA